MPILRGWSTSENCVDGFVGVLEVTVCTGLMILGAIFIAVITSFVLFIMEGLG